jgi:hypothetical protein
MEMGGIAFKQLCNVALDRSFADAYIRTVEKMRVQMSDAKGYLEIVERGLDSIQNICREKGIRVIADSPVVNVFEELIKSSPAAKVILTTRDYSDWSNRKLKDHHEFLCRESIIPKMEVYDPQHNGATFVSNIDMYKGESLPPLHHAFSLYSCAKRAMIRQQVDSGNISEHPAIISAPQLVDLAQTIYGSGKGLYIATNAIADAFIEYNDYIRSVVPSHNLLEVDLWNDDACEFHDKIELFLNTTVDSNWRGSVVGFEVGSQLGNKVSGMCT